MTFSSQLARRSRWLCALALAPSLSAASPMWTMDVALGSQISQPYPGGGSPQSGSVGATLQVEGGALMGSGWSLLGVANAGWYPAQMSADTATVSVQDAFRAGLALRYTRRLGWLLWFGQVSPQTQLDFLRVNDPFMLGSAPPSSLTKWGLAGAASTGVSWKITEGWSAGLRADTFVGTIEAGLGLSLFIAWGAG